MTSRGLALAAVSQAAVLEGILDIGIRLDGSRDLNDKIDLVLRELLLVKLENLVLEVNKVCRYTTLYTSRGHHNTDQPPSCRTVI